ncbi:BA75_02115T0 [Komagataella pastoris]|uniref:BA75_02115T0 n=1 Tax=Komagataella pastoris TaxID=4922 RepID=A0A1B2JBS2_PICPA|nr:BA75_02115T0 [Komagataella pastoris]
MSPKPDSEIDQEPSVSVTSVKDTSHIEGAKNVHEVPQTEEGLASEPQDSDIGEERTIEEEQDETKCEVEEESEEEEEEKEEEKEEEEEEEEIVDEQISYALNYLFQDIHEKIRLRETQRDTTQDEYELSRQEKVGLLLENFDQDQMTRYEFFRRANVNKSVAKRIVQSVLGQNINNNVALLVSTVSKMFVGEMVEKAKEVQSRRQKAQILEQIAQRKAAIKNIRKRDLDESVVDQIMSSKRIRIPKDEPLSPEDIREAWRLYQLETNVLPSNQWRRQGGGDGNMFR